MQQNDSLADGQADATHNPSAGGAAAAVDAAMAVSHYCTVVDPGGVTLLNSNSLEPPGLYTGGAAAPRLCCDPADSAVGRRDCL